MSRKIPLDKKDIKILNFLVERPNATLEELCEEVQITKVPLHKRLRNLEERGLLSKGYQVAGFQYLKEAIYCAVTITVATTDIGYFNLWIRNQNYVLSLQEFQSTSAAFRKYLMITAGKTSEELYKEVDEIVKEGVSMQIEVDLMKTLPTVNPQLNFEHDHFDQRKVKGANE